MIEFLTPEDLSLLILVPAETLRRWRKEGNGPEWVKFGRHVRYERSAVDKWIESQRIEAAIEAADRRIS